MRGATLKILPIAPATLGILVTIICCATAFGGRLRVHEADETCKKESVNEEDVRAEHDACVRARRVLCSTPGCHQLQGSGKTKGRKEQSPDSSGYDRTSEYLVKEVEIRIWRKSVVARSNRTFSRGRTELSREFKQSSQKCATR